MNPTGNKKIVFLGFGMKIDLSAIRSLGLWESPDIEFIVSSNVSVIKDHVHQIPADYNETQNYIAASDLVISKAGWGTVREAVNTGTPLLILERDSMKEDHNTIKYLKKFQLCETISWSNFQEYKVEETMINRLNESVNVYRKTF